MKKINMKKINMKKIKICNIRGVREMEFNVPQSGVHVISGLNGSGKSTLVACIHRLGWHMAFQHYFKTSSANNLDDFAGNITYSKGEDSVSYSYGTSRWTPTPRKNNKIVKEMEFGFKQVLCISANSAERFYIQDKDFEIRKIDDASDFIKNNMNEIFDTDKFINLKQIRVDVSRRRGATSRPNIGFVVLKEKKKFYSEKNFSTGEILILNLLHVMENISEKSLFIVDEIELALHPRAQIKVYDFLTKISDEKNITILVTTHSISLIKKCKNLIYLHKKDDGLIEVVEKCSPALVLGYLAYDEDVIPDGITFVEDKMAKILFKEMLNFYFKISEKKYGKDIRVISAGGYREVIKIMSQTGFHAFPKGMKVNSFLDADALEVINKLDITDEVKILINDNKSNIFYLPITPEQGLCELIEENSNLVTDYFKNIYYNNSTDIGNIINLPKYKDLTEKINSSVDPKTIRNCYKTKLGILLKELSSKMDTNEDDIIRKLFTWFCDIYFSNDDNLNHLRANFGRAFS